MRKSLLKKLIFDMKGEKTVKCNKTVGNQLESYLCYLLATKGWWAHNMAQNQVGQPADVIATKNNIAVLIDCKDCEKDVFKPSRVEGNQEGAMLVWEHTGNKYCYFACRLSDGTVRMVHFDDVMELKKPISGDEWECYETFDEWCRDIEVFTDMV